MSDYSSVAPPQNFNKSQAFAAAVQRAKQIAAKINPSSGGGNEGGSHKRHSDNETLSSEPELKKHARYEPHSPPTPQPQPHHQQTIHAQNNARSQMAPNLNLSGPVTSEDIKVPDKMVGLIIGRGGEQITRLQSESGCKIQMAPDSGGMPDRLCTLTGNAAAIGRAKELVNAIVNQRYKTEGPGGGGGGGGGGGMMRGPPDDMPQRHGGSGGGGPSFVEVMVPGPKVGLIIGKGGETIKMLQEKSGAKMVVIQEGPNQEVEKPLRITGDPQKVEHARSLVYELLAEKETQQTRNAPRQQNRNSGFNERRGGFSNRGEESQFVVPAAKCGVIIGRGGETIKQINQATGAHCELDRRPNNNPNEKVFIIRGTSEQIESAKQMISDKIGLGSNGGPNYNQSSGPNNSQGNYSQSWASQGPSYGQPYHQQHMDPDGGGMGSMGSGGQNQADYSQQWIEYYRSLGLHQEADEIEHQTKSKQGQNNTMATNAPPSVPQPTPSGPPTGQQNGQPDYSAQWAQYYRSLGKHKEAELIEQQMKTKQSAQMPVGGQNPSNPSSFPYQQPGYPYQPVAYPYQPSGNYQYSGSQPQQNQE